MSRMPEFVPPACPAGRLSGRAQPRIAADGLVLRPWELGDAAGLVAAYADPAIQRWHVRWMTEAEAVAWVRERWARWQEETAADWAVVEEDALVGRVGVKDLRLAEGSGEAGFWVLPAARGRGVATRALLAATGWLFGEVGLHRIELAHSVDNAPSCRVAERAGFDYEGTMRRQGLHADGWHDMHLHAKLRDTAVRL
jgi:[ribosomal protein S5]-alanine N-acetyltransferase